LELRGAGFEPTWRRVETVAALREALAAEPWDLIIADYRLPSCTGLEALAAVRETGLDVPTLVVSGAVGEEAAVAAMKAGAADYLIKHHWAKLGPTIERELREAERRRASRQAEVARAESERRLRLAIELAQLGTFTWDIVSD